MIWCNEANPQTVANCYFSHQIVQFNKQRLMPMFQLMYEYVIESTKSIWSKRFIPQF